MLARFFLGFNAVAIGVIGFAYLYDPNLLLARYELETGGPAMDNMLRAVYGGLFLAVAGLFTFGAFRQERRRDVLILATLFFAAQSVGRVASISMAGSPPSTVMGAALLRTGGGGNRTSTRCAPAENDLIEPTSFP